MRTMSGGPCLHYDCSNRNNFGYCKTTVCINEHYQREQWGLPPTTNRSESITVNFPPVMQYQIDKQIDLTQDSIEQIADAIIRKLAAEEGET